MACRPPEAHRLDVLQLRRAQSVLLESMPRVRSSPPGELVDALPAQRKNPDGSITYFEPWLSQPGWQIAVGIRRPRAFLLKRAWRVLLNRR